MAYNKLNITIAKKINKYKIDLKNVNFTITVEIIISFCNNIIKY